MEPRVGPGGDNVDQVIIKLGATSKERALNKLLDNTGSGVNGATGMPGRDGSNNGYKGPTTFNQYTSNGVTNQYSSNVNQLSLGVIAYDDSASGLAQPTTGIGLFGDGVEEGVYDAGADVVWYEIPSDGGYVAPSLGSAFTLASAVLPNAMHLTPALDVNNVFGCGYCVFGVVGYHTNPPSGGYNPFVNLQGYDINNPRYGVNARWNNFVRIGTYGTASVLSNFQFTSSTAVVVSGTGTADYVDDTTGWEYNAFAGGRGVSVYHSVQETSDFEWIRTPSYISGSYQYYDGVHYRAKGTSTWSWSKFGGPTASTEHTHKVFAYNDGVWLITFNGSGNQGYKFWWKPDDDTTDFSFVATFDESDLLFTDTNMAVSWCVDPTSGTLYTYYANGNGWNYQPDLPTFMASITTAGALSVNTSVLAADAMKPYFYPPEMSVLPTGKVLIVGQCGAGGVGPNLSHNNGAYGQVVQQQAWWVYDPVTDTITENGFFGTGANYVSAPFYNSSNGPSFSIDRLQYVGFVGSKYRYIVFNANGPVQYCVIDVTP